MKTLLYLFNHINLSSVPESAGLVLHTYATIDLDCQLRVGDGIYPPATIVSLAEEDPTWRVRAAGLCTQEDRAGTVWAVEATSELIAEEFLAGLAKDLWSIFGDGTEISVSWNGQIGRDDLTSLVRRIAQHESRLKLAVV